VEMTNQTHEHQRNRGTGFRPCSVLLLCIALSTECRGQSNAWPLMTEAQARAVQRALPSYSGWRVATAEDHVGNREELKRMRDSQPGYNPYFTTTAAKGEEGPFALALVRDTTFLLLYFAILAQEYDTPVEVASAGWFREAFLALHGDTLVVASFRSDVLFEFVRNESTGRFVLINDSTYER